MSSRKITTSTLWQLGSQGVMLIIGMLGIKFVTMGLSQSLVGNYQTVYAYLQIFGILADFGLYAVAVRELSRATSLDGQEEKSDTTNDGLCTRDAATILGSLFVLRAVITFIALGSALIFAWSVPVFSGTPLPLGISIAIFVPFFVLLSGMLRTVFQVNYQMHYVFVAEVCSKFIPVCLIGLAILFGARQSDNVRLYYMFLAFGGLGSFLLFIFSLYFARGFLRVRPRFAMAEFKRLARLATPYGLAFLATTLYRQSDVTLIALLRPHDYDIQNAYYGTVLRLAEIGFLLPTFILNSALPVMSRGESEGRDMSEFLGQILLGLLTLGSIVSLFSFFWAKPLILLLTRESYLSTPLSAGSDTALMLLSFSMFLSMIVSFCFYILLNKHSWRMLLLLTTSAAIFSITCNIILIPLLGFVGAGITSIVTHLLLASGLLVVSLGKIRVCLPFAKLIRWFSFSLTIGFLLFFSAPYLLNPIVTLLSGAAGVCLSVAILWMFGLLPSSVFGRGSGTPTVDSSS